MENMTEEPIQIVFDGPPGPTSGHFIEVEQGGKSICFGEWKTRDDGYWVLEFSRSLILAPPAVTEHPLEKLVKNMTDIPPEFAKIARDGFWELTDAKPAPTAGEREEMRQFMRELEADLFVQTPEGPNEPDYLQIERKRTARLFSAVNALILSPPANIPEGKAPPVKVTRKWMILLAQELDHALTDVEDEGHCWGWGPVERRLREKGIEVDGEGK